jgi:hypothetical protein
VYEDSAETAEGHARLQGVTGERVTLLKYLYALSIALLVFALVVFGTAAFPTPQAPDYPPELASVDQYPTDAQQQLLDEQSQSQQVFQEQVSVYNRCFRLSSLEPQSHFWQAVSCGCGAYLSSVKE